MVLLERLSWKAVAWLSGGHAAHVAHIAFSPNGVSQAVVICYRLLSSARTLHAVVAALTAAP